MRNTVIFTKSKQNETRINLESVMSYGKGQRRTSEGGALYVLFLHMSTTIIQIDFTSSNDLIEAVEFIDDFRGDVKEV